MNARVISLGNGDMRNRTFKSCLILDADASGETMSINNSAIIIYGTNDDGYKLQLMETDILEDFIVEQLNNRFGIGMSANLGTAYFTLNDKVKDPINIGFGNDSKLMVSSRLIGHGWINGYDPIKDMTFFGSGTCIANLKNNWTKYANENALSFEDAIDAVQNYLLEDGFEILE